MQNDVNCPNCGQPTEAGAAFCGNCGYPLRADTLSPIAKAYTAGAGDTPASAITPRTLHPAAIGAVATAGIPSYARTSTHPHNQVRAALALTCGIIGVAGGFLIPIIGIALGITGIVLGSLAPRSSKRGVKVAGIVVSGIAVLVGLAVWVYVVAHNPNLRQSLASQQPSAKDGVTSLSVMTPCYSVSLPSQLNVDNASGSCELDAYNGSTIANSSNTYKVLSTNVPAVTAANLSATAKNALESDVAANLPGSTVTSARSGIFAGDPAYFIQAHQSSQNTAVAEVAVLHKGATSNNFFVLVHVTTGTSTDLSKLEQKWQWN